MNLAHSPFARPRLLTSLVVAMFLVASLAGCVKEDDLTPDQRAYRLDSELMCPVCDGQTIDQSHAQIAEDMKQTVREKIAAGESNQEIRDYFVDRYGEIVLASPEASGFNLIVWLMPVVIGGGGALAVFWVLKNMRSQSSSAGTDSTISLQDRQLEQYLVRVDRDTGVSNVPANTGDSKQSEVG